MYAVRITRTTRKFTSRIACCSRGNVPVWCISKYACKNQRSCLYVLPTLSECVKCIWTCNHLCSKWGGTMVLTNLFHQKNQWPMPRASTTRTSDRDKNNKAKLPAARQGKLSRKCKSQRPTTGHHFSFEKERAYCQRPVSAKQKPTKRTKSSFSTMISHLQIGVSIIVYKKEENKTWKYVDFIQSAKLSRNILDKCLLTWLETLCICDQYKWMTPHQLFELRAKKAETEPIENPLLTILLVLPNVRT